MGRLRHTSDFNYVNEPSLPSELFRFYFKGWLRRRGAYKEYKLWKMSAEPRYKSEKAQNKKLKEELKKQGSSQVSRVTTKLLKMKYLDERYVRFPTLKDKSVINERKGIRGNLNPFYEFAESNGVIFSKNDKRFIEGRIFENPDSRRNACKHKDILEGMLIVIETFLFGTKIEKDKEGNIVCNQSQEIVNKPLSRKIGNLQIILFRKNQHNKIIF
jgi:hypothetical protein